MGLSGSAGIVGVAEFKPRKIGAEGVVETTLEQMAELTRQALADAGLQAHQLNGLVTCGIAESAHFVPATVAEYLGLETHFAELVDLGGASSVSAVMRAAAAVELGFADAVLVVVPSGHAPMPPNVDPAAYYQKMMLGASSDHYGSPQAEFEIPYGHLAQNTGYAMIAQRYADAYGYDERAMAKIAAQQRFNACANPDAIFYGKPISEDDVLASRVIAPPLHMLEIVMPVFGGGAVIVASKDIAARCRHRPAWVTGAGEHLAVKYAGYAKDLLKTPIGPASDRAFAMAGIKRDQVDLAQIYDCYTITVLLTLEDAGFCPKGEGMRFIREHDLRYCGDFPVNSHGGQLSFGQPGQAGGMTQVVEAVRQLRGAAGERQLRCCDTVYVSGTGGVMSEQSAIILQGG